MATEPLFCDDDVPLDASVFPMENLFKFLASLDVPNRYGWILLLVGGAALGLIRLGVWPFHVGGAITASTAGLFSLVGAAILVTGFFSFTGAKIADWRAQRKLTKLHASEAIANLDVLYPMERRQIAFVLRGETPRVRGDVSERLRFLKVLEPPPLYAPGVYTVNPTVWKKRGELLAKFKDVPTEAEFPNDPDVYMKTSRQ